jgi:2-C-methyl-D-erythritol 2,4-cyclodiphosphate synthase
MLGGIAVPSPRGLAGHSDADAALHALGDALLGAASLGDLGVHFPSSDPSLAGIDSGELVRRIVELLAREGWSPSNADVTIVAEEPRLAPHVEAMRARISDLLGIGIGQVSVKSKSTDHLGFVGRREGIAALAVASVVPEARRLRARARGGELPSRASKRAGDDERGRRP